MKYMVDNILASVAKRNSNEFDEFQIEEIQKGIDAGLTDEQMSFLTRPEFNSNQMYQIRQGFENGLSFEQVSVYSNQRLNHYKMNEIRTGLESGMDIEKVKLFAEMGMPHKKMKWIKSEINAGATIELLKLYTNKMFDDKQLEQIRTGAHDKFTDEQISIFAKPKFNYEQMECIRMAIKFGLSEENVKQIADGKFDERQKRLIFGGFSKGLTKEQINIYAKPEFSYEQMEQIRQGLINGLTINQVRQFADKNLSEDAIKKMRTVLEKKHITDKMTTFTKGYIVYGASAGEKLHRNRESFFDSYEYNFTNLSDVRQGEHPDQFGVGYVKVLNSDITGTNDYSIVIITRDTEQLCDREMEGQWSDGIFENSNVSYPEPLSPEKTAKYIDIFEKYMAQKETKQINLHKNANRAFADKKCVDVHQEQEVEVNKKRGKNR